MREAVILHRESYCHPFDKWFHRAAGKPESLAKEAERRGVSWLSGISHSRAAFAPS